MNLIEKWKTRDTKKKLREENIRLKTEIEVRMKMPYPVCTVERNVQKVCAKRMITEIERGIPTEIVKHELLNKLSEHLSDFVEYDFENDRYGNMIYTAISYVATGGVDDMVDMNDYMQAIIKALQVIHDENVMILSVMTNADRNCEPAKKMDEIFEKAIEGVLKRK